MPGLVPGIHVFAHRSKTWMPGTSPAMTEMDSARLKRSIRQTIALFDNDLADMPRSACVLPSLVLMSQRRSLARPAATGTSHHSADCPG